MGYRYGPDSLCAMYVKEKDGKHQASYIKKNYVWVYDWDTHPGKYAYMCPFCERTEEIRDEW